MPGKQILSGVVLLWIAGSLSAQELPKKGPSNWYFKEYASKTATPDYLQLPKLRLTSKTGQVGTLSSAMPVIKPNNQGYLRVIRPDSTRKHYLRIHGATALPAPNIKE